MNYPNSMTGAFRMDLERQQNNSTAVAAITPQGGILAVQIAHALGGTAFIRPDMLSGSLCPAPESTRIFTKPLGELLPEIYQQYESIVLIMATGIAVRLLAPHLRSKLTDPAVVVMDEKGRYAISLLSGHIGGANQLARDVAQLTGGEAVITTATDVNQLPAFDELAVRNHCRIENPAQIKKISSALLKGETIYIISDIPVAGKLPPHAVLVTQMAEVAGSSSLIVISHRNEDKYSMRTSPTLIIRPRSIVLGAGCRKGVAPAVFKETVLAYLAGQGISLLSVAALCTVELKKDEPCMKSFCEQTDVKFTIFTREEIAEIDDRFPISDKVMETVGVGSVAAPSAYLASGITPPFERFAGNGITLCASVKESSFIL